MRQTRKASFVESVANVTVGYGVAVISQLVVLPFFDIKINLKQDAELALVFTVISLVRSFTLRRVFEFLRVEGLMP